MDDAASIASLPDDPARLKALLIAREQVIAQQTQTIAQITRQRDEFHLEKLRLEVRLARLLKQVYGPRADRIGDPAQLLLDFARQLEDRPVDAADLPPAEDSNARAESAESSQPRRLRTRGRRDIGSLDHLPLIEHTYELTDALCKCPTCQRERQKIGTEVSYTIEHIPASLLRIRHIQHKYACRVCEQAGDNPNITLAAKTGGSPIDKGMVGPGLLAYVVTAKFADYLPLHRLQHIFGRDGFELDRSTMCLWMADVARIAGPLYQRMAQRVLQSHVLATDDTVLPLLAPGKTKQARMWIYQGDDANPYNVFAFTESRKRDGPAGFLKDFRGTLLADAYGGYDGIVLNQELPRAGCWAHARRKFVEAEPVARDDARAILALVNQLFKVEARLKESADDARLPGRQAEARPIIDALHALLLRLRESLLPKHPLAQAIAYTLNQWAELTLFLRDGTVPIHNNLAEQEMKRIALLRKNALFVATPRGGETAAILSSLTSTCRRHAVNPQAYLTQLLANLPDTPVNQLDQWLPDQWKIAQATPPTTNTE